MIKQRNLFIDIVQGTVKADIVYQDNLVTAFYDVNPKAPIHILIVPNILIPTVNDLQDHHAKIMGRLFLIASKIACKKNINISGYRLIVNCNNDAGQEIYHIHMHLLGGKPLGPLLQEDN